MPLSSFNKLPGRTGRWRPPRTGLKRNARNVATTLLERETIRSRYAYKRYYESRASKVMRLQGVDSDGLFLHILPTGNRSLQIRYRDPLSGKEQTLTFGLWPAITPDQAFARRDAARAQVVRGGSE